MLSSTSYLSYSAKSHAAVVLCVAVFQASPPLRLGTIRTFVVIVAFMELREAFVTRIPHIKVICKYSILGRYSQK